MDKHETLINENALLNPQFFWTDAAPSISDPTWFAYNAGVGDPVLNRGRRIPLLAVPGEGKDCVEYIRKAGQVKGKLRRANCNQGCPVLCCFEGYFQHRSLNIEEKILHRFYLQTTP